MASANPVAELIDRRLAALQLTKRELIVRLGYKNVSKGLNRLHQLYQGEFGYDDFLLARLPEALQMAPSDLRAAKTKAVQNAALEARRQELRRFKPHAVFLTEHRIPSQIVIAAIIGADRHRYMFFDYKTDPRSFRSIVLEAMPASIPMFGRVVGFVINHSPTYAIEYDAGGKLIEVRNQQKVLGQLLLKV